MLNKLTTNEIIRLIETDSGLNMWFNNWRINNLGEKGVRAFIRENRRRIEQKFSNKKVKI